MATRFTKSTKMGRSAMRFISGICDDSDQAIFRAISDETDIGIDGHIELLYKNEEPTGAVAFIQSKGGPSQITKSGEYRIRANKKHFETWSRYKNTVIGIVYNPKLNDARWVSITEHLESHPN